MTDDPASVMNRWVQAYVDLGWHMLILPYRSKVPFRRSGGVLDATDDRDQLTDAIRRLHGRCNLAVATGRSGLLVIDVDRGHANGANGFATVRELARRAGEPIPHGPEQSTPSGGRHLLFAPVDGIGPSQGSIGPGADVRAGESYVVVAPSATPAGRYWWEASPLEPLPTLPAWLTPPRIKPTRVISPQAIATCAPGTILGGLVRTVIEAPNGTRNARYFWACCRLGEHSAAGRVSLDEGAAALLAAAEQAGLPDSEADKSLRSALRRTVNA